MNQPIHALKKILKEHKEGLSHAFSPKHSIVVLTKKLVDCVDGILLARYRQHNLPQHNNLCLIALGSYGRRELQPASDIDLLLLYSETPNAKTLSDIQAFIQDCWDIGLDMGHQVTSITDCAELASHDLSVISSLLDMRHLIGNQLVMQQLQYKIHPLQMWSSQEFFFSKLQEQKQRDQKYRETAYNLEPNVKNGAGGLRDLQLLLHVGKRHFSLKKLSEGIPYGFLTDKEYEEFMHCLHFLWKIRFALHLVANKKEDRLLFDHQRTLSTLFGYHDTQESLAIEQFMKSYFKVIKRSRELNEMVLQWFSETILYQQKQKITYLDNVFQLSNQHIELRHAHGLQHHPERLLELFLWMAKRPDIIGVRANTIRIIHQNLYRIDPVFRCSKKVTHCFMEILKTASKPFEIFRQMSRYGILGRYLECYGLVTGQMQYDLFHVYTVDQHTLFVIRNLGEFLDKTPQDKFPLCHQLMLQIEQPEILYLAALFHDIAKGRGGDHAELGANEALLFAKRHQLNTEETNLLIWLVKNHLLMSHTAQRQDIYDPKIIQKFCCHIPKASYLTYLYLLTVADICATNPSLWNAWRDSLLKELYHAAKQVLHKENYLTDKTTMIAERQRLALATLANHHIPLTKIHALWQGIQDKYFLHETPETIAVHTKAILNCHHFPLVLILPHHSLGGLEVFIYMPHRADRFAITTAVLHNYQVTIQEATIFVCDNQFELATYIVLNEHHQAILDEQRISQLKQTITQQLSIQTGQPQILQRRLSNTQSHLYIQPQITYTIDDEQHTCLLLIAPDRPGLLAHISHLLFLENIHLHAAKITTAGERAEDMFYLTTSDGAPLNVMQQQSLTSKLMRVIAWSSSRQSKP